MGVQHCAEKQSEVASPIGKLPELPPEVWRAIARATLAAHRSSLGAWLQLRTVSRDWRQALEGARDDAWLHSTSWNSAICDERREPVVAASRGLRIMYAARAGSPVTLICDARLKPGQWQCLRTTAAKFRCVSFHSEDAGTTQLLVDATILVSHHASSTLQASTRTDCQAITERVLE